MFVIYIDETNDSTFYAIFFHSENGHMRKKKIRFFTGRNLAPTTLAPDGSASTTWNYADLLLSLYRYLSLAQERRRSMPGSAQQ